MITITTITIINHEKIRTKNYTHAQHQRYQYKNEKTGSMHQHDWVHPQQHLLCICCSIESGAHCKVVLVLHASCPVALTPHPFFYFISPDPFVLLPLPYPHCLSFLFFDAASLLALVYLLFFLPPLFFLSCLFCPLCHSPLNCPPMISLSSVHPSIREPIICWHRQQ